MDQTRLNQVDRFIWLLIALTGCCVFAAAAVGPFEIDLSSFWKSALSTTIILFLSWYYMRIRKDALLAAALTSVAQVLTFASVGAPLSYVAASAAMPLWDLQLANLDHQLGFNWAAWLAFMNARPLAHSAFATAYSSFALQVTAVVVALAIAGQAVRLRLFIISFVLTTLITITISALVPAQGAWGYLHISALDSPAIVPSTRDLHLPTFFGLRDGTFRRLIVDGAEGIITFPSLHAALGFLFICALWPVRYLRWISVLLNLTMIAATPIDGGHYFCDAVAGIAISALSWSTIMYLFTRRGLTQPNWSTAITAAHCSM